MRLFKLILSIVLAAVTAVYGVTMLRQRTSGSDVPPTISCPQEVLELSVQDPEEVLFTGITASDRQDGDLTDHILLQGVSRQITDNMTTVTYLVFDSDGNSASATRTIRYTDYRKPWFTLNQDLVYSNTQPIALLDRLNAMDCLDGDITASIRVGTLTATNDPEISTVTVQVTNSLSDTARLTLPVITYSGTGNRADIVLKEYLIYLKQGDSFKARQYLDYVQLPMDERGENADVQISGRPDTSAPGTYMVYYRYPYNETTAIAVLTVVVE